MQLVLHPLSDTNAQKTTIDEPRTLVGRGSDCDLNLPHPLVSRHHAELIIDDECAIVRDLNTTNGTFVNGYRVVDEQLLQDGDILIFAAVFFEVQMNQSAIHKFRRYWNRETRIQESVNCLVE